MITRHDVQRLLLAACPTFEPQWRRFEKDYGPDYAEWSLLPVMRHFARHLYDLVDDDRPESIAESIALAWRMQTEGDDEIREAIDAGFVPALDDFRRRAEDCFDRLREFVPDPLHRWWDELPREPVAGLSSLRTYYRTEADRCSRCGAGIEPPSEEKQIIEHAAGTTRVVLCDDCLRHYRHYYAIIYTTLALFIVGVLLLGYFRPVRS